MATIVEAKPEKRIKIPVKQRSASFSPALKYKIMKDEEIAFTKEKAFEFLELKTFEGERSVREGHVQFLFDEYCSGRFLWQNVILASAKLPNGDVFRINGQHTCWMRVNVPEKNEPLGVKARSMTYSVSTEEQLRSLYSAFDRGAPRSTGHIAKVIMLGGKTIEGIPPTMIGLLIAGFKLYFSDEKWKRERTSINEWIGMIEANYSTLVGLTGRFMSMHLYDCTFAKRSSVMASMYFTFEKNVEASTEFWTAVLSGIGLETKTDPRWQLRKYLETHGHSIMSGLDRVSQEEALCVCLTQWNHWREGNSVTTVKPVNARPKIRA